MLLCLREPPVRFLWCCCSSFLIFICRCFFVLLLFFIHIFFSHVISHPSVDYCQVFTPILYFQPNPSQSDSRHFHFQPFGHLLAASATALSELFLPTDVFFTLRSFIDILTCVYHGFPGSRQSFLEVCRASYWWSSQFADPFHLFVWFRVTCNLHTQNDSVLNSTIY